MNPLLYGLRTFWRITLYMYSHGIGYWWGRHSNALAHWLYAEGFIGAIMPRNLVH
jgi:hypothetical protein